MNKILLLGGTGFVGRHVCEKLARLQCRVTVVTRRRDKARHLQMLPLLDVIEADVHDSAALAPLLADHDAVVNLVAILQGNEAAFEKAHVQLPLALARACEASGLRRIVHISALGASPGSASMYQRSKARGEAVLLSTGLDVTVLRPSVIFGAEDKFLNTFAGLQQVFPVVPLAAADARFQPVWVEDVADAVVHCLQEPDTVGQIYEVCGPDVFTLRQLVTLAGRYTGVNDGKGRPVIALPAALGRLQAALMELAPGEPLLSRDNLDAMATDNIASGKLPGLQALGIQPAALDAIAPSYLGAQGLRSGLMAKRKTAGRF
ncbi:MULTISPECIES: complex I NDUFA9 subunit family protein [unclassified Polaromonas]|uniref:complex I NDUFA9 subunit family protein n=1 Tax=unclassified Polaromonas TaxID=2638319 RepID=UPI000F0846A6|nr:MULTISPECIES: complex I NDUFA9 subunit family protein [unclassified Polaromonas]AYQ27114.1 complex I NDUFA9 subunit family protein [Polaromonas sp. SP1]QGJ18040.1 NAD(P)H-binding protein [Polaromonas sp. Pch-P]